MTPPDVELMSIIQGMIEATEGLQAALEAQNENRREQLRRLGEGEELRDIVVSMPVAGTRTTAKAAQERMESQRKALRSAIMCRCIDEGLTNRDIAKIWGVSVQLVSRYTGTRHVPG